MSRTLFGVGLITVGLAQAFPPGAPMTEYGPQEASVSLFFDHSGVTLYEDPAFALMNGTGLTVEYAPWPYLQMGGFGGASEFDIAVPESKASDTSVNSFNSDYSVFGGGTLKLATPRVIDNSSRLVAYGSAAFFQAEDIAKNIRRGFYYQGGLTLQIAAFRGLNFVLGGEYHFIDGEQETGKGAKGAFGINQPTDIDLLRGVVGIEYTFTGQNRPFISLSFRPTGAVGWDDKLGLKNGSIAISMGVITSLGKSSPASTEEEYNSVDE